MAKLAPIVLAAAVALSAGLTTAWLTRPQSPPPAKAVGFLGGRDHPSSNATDPLNPDEISYQVARDRIRAIDQPAFMTAADAGFVPGATNVIGVDVAGEARAYPIGVLSRVEIVNDQIRGHPIAVTW
jgi:uncharacterized protein DUF3179